ncbi:MAG: NADH-quinone oxidoreductase subunit N [bacterium]|nr:NADH-quinone oxidoreductase subunit N [bacterium]
MEQLNYLSLLPEIVIILAGILVIAADLIIDKKDNIISEVISVLGLIIALFLTGNQFLNPEIISQNNMLISDSYAVFFKVALIILSLMVILISSHHIRERGITHRAEYFTFILFATVGMMIMAGSLDLVTVYVGLELMAISIYILVGISRTEFLSNEAALKYFLLGLLATAFLLYGISFTYGMFGTTNLVVIKNFLQNNTTANSGYILVLVFLVIAFGFKVAAVPFHMWTPDAYEGAMTPVTGFMSVGPKLAAFAVLGRVFVYSLLTLKAEWTLILTIVSILTMTVGNVVAIAQTNIKRMLAYSSIAHAGYCLMGLVAAGGLAGSLGLQSVLFYLSGYLFMNVGAFSIIIFLNKKGISGSELDDFSGLNERYPGIALMMSVILLSLAGVPPTTGFAGKLYVFMAAVKSKYMFLAVIGVLNSVIALYYYLRIIVYMYMKKPADLKEETNRSVPLLLVLGIAVVAILVLGIYPEPVLNFAKSAAGGMF